MINRQTLLTDLQSLLKKLEADLLLRSNSSEVPEVGQTLREEYARAKKAERTALNYETWRSDAITQTAAAWVLSCVFVRFLEDNRLIDPPKIAGPGERLRQARDEHTLFFQDPQRARLTDREYLLAVFDELAQLPGTHDVFGAHNPLRQLPNWLGPDAAGELLRFFQKIDANTGHLIHDFTDAAWNTRFLGDLYQDLSEAARKKYALLQTPDFVEQFILDRTLEPAIDQFGLDAHPEGIKMIDPACGSGHFLLGAFSRILAHWQKKEPGTNTRALVKRALDSVHGVDVNPFAVAIARFRLLLAAMQAEGITRLKSAPAYQFHLATGDSLYHGRARQKTLGDWTDEAHYFATEDAADLRQILRPGTYHCVVANPPYITPKDRAANQAYRQLYPETCYRQYSLAVPFMELLFRLAADGGGGAGYVGQITANSFMKREFGKKLIESFFPQVDLTHVIDTSGAYIPGHGTPTVILLGRNRRPVSPTIRTVMGIRGEPSTPDDPAQGQVWSAIVGQIDRRGSESEFVSVADSDREQFHTHPWSIGGGGAADLKERLESLSELSLKEICTEIGFGAVTREDEAYLIGKEAVLRLGIPADQVRALVSGDEIRDWHIWNPTGAIWPYCPESMDACGPGTLLKALWPLRTGLSSRVAYGLSQIGRGLKWFEYSMFFTNRFRTPLSIAFAFVASHNHFVLDRGGKVFNRSAPVIKLPAEATEDDHLGLLGLLNSSVACFWMKQVMTGKHMGDGGSAHADPAYQRFEFAGTQLSELPIPEAKPVFLARKLDEQATQIDRDTPEAILQALFESAGSLVHTLDTANTQRQERFSKIVADQEELDWQCYKLYGLTSEELFTTSAPSIKLGERAFEIVLARKVARGETQTTWFERHGSTPITELPKHWPDDYKRLVERRIELIENDKSIGLIERPEYKRRWNTEPWESQLERALRTWLLDRLESYFDFDGRMNDEGKPSAKFDVQLISVARLADVARQDEAFMEVGQVYRDDPAFDVERLVAELVQAEQVPLLPVMRYKPSGLRKRAEWENTWQLQRLEDKLRAGEQVSLTDPQWADCGLTDQQRQQISQWQQETPPEAKADDRTLDTVLAIPVPPKYISGDFISSGGARYWSLRGKLDVPKERWISLPHCEGPDGTLMLAWAGYNHLQQAQAISAYYVDVQERLGGREDARLVPLLAGIIELLPWLKQWHHEVDPEFGQRMDEVFEGFVTEEAKGLGMTVGEIRGWEPVKKVKRSQRGSKVS